MDDLVPVLPPAPKSSRPVPLPFRCGYCEKQYARQDHLDRHVRSHTNERPFSCGQCGASFGRPDLLKRHAANHQHRPQSANGRHANSVGSSSPLRVSKACRSCALAKVKCEESRPCSHCRRNNIECVAGGSHVVYTTTSSPPTRTASTIAHRSDHLGLDETPNFQTPTSVSSESWPLSPVNISSACTNDSSGTYFQSEAEGNTLDVVKLGDSFFPDFLRDVMMASNANQLTGSDSGSCVPPQNVMDWAFSSNTDEELLDFDFLDEVWNERDAIDSQRKGELHAKERDSNIALGAEAFKSSTLGTWEPYPREHWFGEQSNLSIPQDLDYSAEIQGEVHPIANSNSLSSSSRDRILATVIENCRSINIPKVVASFPGSGLLGRLIKDFLRSESKQVDCWIHLPTFDINEQNSILLAIMAATGASRTSIPVLRKLGSALHEAILAAISNTIECDNSKTRELVTWQAFDLQLELGFWSGNKRKVEISEACSQPLVTMLRRSGCFQLSRYNFEAPLLADSEKEVEMKWQKWVETESTKRFVYHVFIYDAQVSLTLHVNPMISYAEMQLPLPENEQLWKASNALEWRECYLKFHSGGRLPSLRDAIQDPKLLVSMQSSVDIELTKLLVLYGFWHLIWVYHQMNMISMDSGEWSRLILNSRHSELCQAMQKFRLRSPDQLDKHSPQVFMVQELVSMHLYVSIEELQLFAGKENREAASKANDSARQWISSPACRQTIWHAARVFDAAEHFSGGLLSDFYAIALYQASLAFWSYNVVDRLQGVTRLGKGPVQTDVTAATAAFSVDPMVWLNEGETDVIQKFIVLGIGRPVIKCLHETALLTDAVQVARLIQEVFRRNHSKNAMLPPLVENLAQLIHNLGLAAYQGGRVQASTIVSE